MVINNLYIFWSVSRPHKAHSELIVSADAVLSGSGLFQGFQAISRRHAQIVQIYPPNQAAQVCVAPQTRY